MTKKQRAGVFIAAELKDNCFVKMHKYSDIFRHGFLETQRQSDMTIPYSHLQ